MPPLRRTGRQDFQTPAPSRPLPVRLTDRNRVFRQFRTAHTFQTGRQAADVPHRRATRDEAFQLAEEIPDGPHRLSERAFYTKER